MHLFKLAFIMAGNAFEELRLIVSNVTFYKICETLQGTDT